jgi:hypothetical protein
MSDLKNKREERIADRRESLAAERVKYLRKYGINLLGDLPEGTEIVFSEERGFLADEDADGVEDWDGEIEMMIESLSVLPADKDVMWIFTLPHNHGQRLVVDYDDLDKLLNFARNALDIGSMYDRKTGLKTLRDFYLMTPEENRDVFPKTRDELFALIKTRLTVGREYIDPSGGEYALIRIPAGKLIELLKKIPVEIIGDLDGE